MKNLFFVLLTIALLTSCKKETTENPTNPTAAKNLIKSTSVWDNGAPDIDDYSYDAKGRISVLKEDTRTSTFNYVSASSLIVTETKNTDNSLNGTKECNINDKGYVTKLVYKNPAGTVTYTYNYIYNADGYITRVEAIPTSGSGYEVDYTIVDGNVVSSKNYNAGVFNRTNEYIYDNSKINKTKGSYAGFWQSNTLFGKGSKNLVSEYKSFSPAGTITWHSQFSYVMDASGYPAQLNINNVLQGKQGVDTYIYQ